jgi:protein-S-isoprenylcysteine O-methyltransferase Ste14
LALIVVFGALVVRIRVEERTLRETLPGYAAYTQRVQYRVFPFVW